MRSAGRPAPGSTSLVARQVGGLYCLVAVAFWYWTPGSDFVVRLLAAGQPWHIRALIDHWYADALFGAFIVGAILIGRPALQDVMGRPPRARDALPVALAVIITFCASGAITTFTMVPLSFVLPSFVNWWLGWSYPVGLYIAGDGSIPVVANALRLVSLCVVTPILEELLFRGYLLHAWSRKWGLFTGVLFSSALFGAIHGDPVQAMATGVGFALLYLRTQSLWAPIIAHGAYNVLATAWNVGELWRFDWEYVIPTVEDLQSEWWLGAIELIIVVVLVDQIMRRGALAPLRLPAPAEKLGHAADRGRIHS